ncbi:MAG: DNA ligase [Planctomycetaceae bacterium]
MPDIPDGETVEVQGSAAKPYVLTNVGGVYSCSCPAWRNQSTAIEKRTCKHLRKYRGEKEEEERLGGELPTRAVKSSSDVKGPPMLLAHAWDNTQDLSGWWISEKLDGVRAYWDGSRFLSRQGNEFMAPNWFVDGLPLTPLDGELWLDRKAFQKTISIVRRQDRSEHWKQIRYIVFDAPAEKSVFEERIEFLKDHFATRQQPYTRLLDHTLCRNVSHLRRELQRVESLGGEGLMLRQPGSRYEIGRSASLLKVKTFHDAEATVIGHQNGRGKHKGRLGALVVRLADGTEFSVGTGFTDKQREQPPAVGSVVTFRYQEFTDAGVPRFPSFVREDAAVNSSSNADPAARRAEWKPSSGSKAGRATKTSSKKKMAPAADVPTAGAAASSDDANRRYFEFSDGKSHKFWEISVDGNAVTVRYGRIGSKGTTNRKDFADAEAARKHQTKLIDEKTSKGYAEV